MMQDMNDNIGHGLLNSETYPASVIQFCGGAADIIWKYPGNIAVTGALLLVHESQEAIVVRNGRALDLFGPGRYQLWKSQSSTEEKISVLTSPLTEVYFINRAEHMALKWGTNNKIEYIDPVYRFPIQIGASGTMSLRVVNSRQLLVKLAGLQPLCTQDDLSRMFHAVLMSCLKTELSQAICRHVIGVFELDLHLAPLSRHIEEALRPEYANYGISLERLDIATIVKPEDDETYRLFRTQQIMTVCNKSTDHHAYSYTPVHCSRCSVLLPFGAKFCPICGESIHIIETICCPACTASVPIGNFCLLCGASLQNLGEPN